MIENEFGKLIEKLMYFSGEKNYSLAIELGYDVSYISKWINLTTLPTSKNIKNINKIVADFIVKSANDASLNDLADYFKVEKNENNDKSEVLKKIIEQKLNEAYLYSYNKNNKKNLKKDNDKNNSIQKVNPALRKKYLDNEILNFIDEVGSSNITVLCDLFSLNRDDKINLAGIKKGENHPSDIQRNFIKIKYLISFNENIKDIVFNVMLFIYMITSKWRIRINIYSCYFTPNTFISAVENKCVHTAIYNNNKCLTNITSTDENVVDEMYDTLEDIANSQSMLTFHKRTPEEVIIGQDNINYIMDSELKWLIGEISELFMPTDLFLEVGESIFGENPEILLKLKKIDTILQNVTYNSEIDVAMYECIFRKYVYNGKITFFNKPITLNLTQRKRHMEYMKKLLLEKENIHFRVIDNSQLGDFKNDEKPSLYLSRNITLLKESSNELGENYLIVKDQRLDNICKLFFDEILKEEENKNKNRKNEIINLLLDSLRYVEILDDNVDS